MMNLNFFEYDLENGLHVILYEDHAVPIVSLSVMYHVGTKNEAPNRTGFAHFFEHLLFEGSKYLKRGEFDRYIQDAGGSFNANTSKDRTFYYEILPSNHLITGLWLESERMLHAKVDQIGIDTQRQVVKEERSQRYDNRPYGLILEEGMRRAYNVHPYQWSTIGSMDHLADATTKDYIEFYKKYYVPNNAVLCICGDFERSETIDLVKKYFGDIPKGEIDIIQPPINEPKLEGPIRDIVFDQVQLPALIQLFRIPQMGAEDFYALRLLADLLSNGDSSRLIKRLVDQDELAIFVGSYPFELEHPGVIVQFAIANASVSLENIERVIWEEIKDLQDNIIDDQEFEKLKNQFEIAQIDTLTSLVGIAEELSSAYTYFKDTNRVNTEIERYKSVTKEQIRQAARNYLKIENSVTLEWLPK